jgi:glucosamine 6-phosphate synthetase-like amidotransferase/phosphosugar isomerase protein
MGFGARVAWVGPQAPPEFPVLPTPRYVGIGRGIAQVVPLQLLSVTLAVSGGHQPGVFRNGSKVTTDL